MNFSNGVAEIQQKYEREREKSWREKILNFGNHIIKILLPKLADRMARSVLVLGDAQRETNCGNAIAEIGGNFFFWQLWQCHCRKWEGKKICGCRNLGRN